MKDVNINGYLERALHRLGYAQNVNLHIGINQENGDNMFEMGKNPEEGRNGKITIDKKEIYTPMYIPSRSDFLQLTRSDYVKKEYIESIDMGVHEEYFNLDRMKKIKNEKKIFKRVENTIWSKTDEIASPRKILNFEFSPDVTKIKSDYLRLLLEIQHKLDLSTITIPNTFNDWNYREAINYSYKWKKQESIDKPLMAIVCNESHLNTVEKNLTKIDAVGINLRRENIPLLYYVREKLKQKEIWVHSFMTPRRYNVANYDGTLGILINFFGIDTISPLVVHPETSKMFKYKSDQKSPEEKEEEAGKNKYFNPIDYGCYDFNNLENVYGSRYSLSHFCDCEVCEKNTIGEITSDYEFTFVHSRSHDVFSNIIESHKYHESIEDEECTKYFNNKVHAKKIINKTKRPPKVTDYL